MKLSWLKKLHGFIHGKVYIMFHVLLEFAPGAPPRDGHDRGSKTMIRENQLLVTNEPVEFEK